MKFTSPGDSHQHSLQTLLALYEYADFMESISSVIDLGCGTGEDLEWWATRTFNDDSGRPLNISCTGVDLLDRLPVAKKHQNITYLRGDFENESLFLKQKYDVLWCHDAFQYCIDPIGTLGKWWRIANDSGMLILALPQTTNCSGRQHDIYLANGCYYHHTIVSLIHMLAVSGWDCRSGFFRKEKNSPWIHAVAYKSEHAPMDPKTTTWYDLVEKKLLPESADKSIHAHGAVMQRDLILPWLDKSLSCLGLQ